MHSRYDADRLAPYAARRARALEALTARGAAALLMSARPKLRNADSEHRYRPDSDLWRLTGLGEPHCALLLLPAQGDRAARSVVFLRERDREQELWSGRRLGVERAASTLGVDEARPIEALWKDLPALLEGCARLCYRTGVDAQCDAAVLDVLTRLRAKTRANTVLPHELLDTAPVLHELRLYKDEAELRAMSRAAQITARAHTSAMRSARAGMREYELEALIEYEFRRSGADGPAYNSIVASGANACVLHYVDNDELLREGQLLLVDAGAECEHYAADVTRTFPISARFSPAQRELYELVLAAQLAAIDAVRSGRRFDDPHSAALRVLVGGLCELGLLRESPSVALESGAFKRFYMHRTSHWLGLDVHDAGSYVRDGASRELAPGMVLTVEPGLYIDADDESVDPRWRGIGIRIEDDVLVGAEGPHVLTSDAPKRLADIEQLRAEASAKSASAR
jgi:Xaa-Pro aminopeptidase